MKTPMNRVTHRLVTAILILLTSAAFAGTATGQRPGSIYDPSQGPISMIADKTARRAGDLITVLIAETQNLKNEEVSRLQRKTTLDYQMTNFDLYPSLFDTLPGLAADSVDNFDGRANYEKKGNFTARLTAIVIDALPNGTLVIQGRREIRVDGELKVIEFSGIVRAFDIKPDNSVESELVAEARVSYVGEGTLTDTTNRVGLGGMIHRAIVWLWPF